MGRYELEERNEWRRWVTPKPLITKPVHRWHVFPHSYTSELVHSLGKSWKLSSKDRILDPFAGAGTTLLSAQELNIPASGYDISPFAVFVTHVKLANYEVPELLELWSSLRGMLNRPMKKKVTDVYPALVQKALPGKLLVTFDHLSDTISNLNATEIEKDFFRLALLSTIPSYSRAIAEGGWLKWTNRRNRSSGILKSYSEKVELMINDLKDRRDTGALSWSINLGDARTLPDENESYTAVITSPPYPNRHDYTRVFGVELMFGFLNWEQTRQVRYQSFHSHPEARPIRPCAKEYVRPVQLEFITSELKNGAVDSRICKMLNGYFLDLYIALREIERVCKRNSHIAMVVGNAQYGGIPILVDELTAEIGEMAGLECQQLIVARYRGNSAQQMGTFGRRPSRESVVVFRKF